MDKLIIKGPATLKGEVTVSKAKNAYLPIMAATLLSDKKIRLKNLPKLRDIQTTKKLLRNLGTNLTDNADGSATFETSRFASLEATYDLVKTMRASILVLGPILAREGYAKVSLPGGCAIGTRPIDIHLENLKKMGAQIDISAGYVEGRCQKLKGAKMALSFPSVGATENLMMAACLAKGESIIENAALEPEISDLANFLKACGAKIEGIGTSTLRIQGQDSLGGCDYEAIGDRIEAATYIMAALMGRNSEVTVKGINTDYIKSILFCLENMGAKMQVGAHEVRVLPSELKSGKFETAPYPGLPTDVQAQLMVLCLVAEGPSFITENIFENRFMHVPELMRLGADIVLKGKTAIIQGNRPLSGAPVMCTDLRASAALVLAALAASGETHIGRVYHLDRGYENLDKKLQALGVDIKRVVEE